MKLPFSWLVQGPQIVLNKITVTIGRHVFRAAGIRYRSVFIGPDPAFVKDPAVLSYDDAGALPVGHCRRWIAFYGSISRVRPIDEISCVRITAHGLLDAIKDKHFHLRQMRSGKGFVNTRREFPPG